MKAFLATFTILFAAGAAHAQPPQDMLARVVALEERVAALERHHATPAAAAAPTTKRSYNEAHALALAKGLPLVTWHGDAICPSCVSDTDGEEFINFVGPAPTTVANAMTVYVPDGGELRLAGVITEWRTGDAVHGHVPSLRRAIQRFRTNRTVTRPTAAYQPAMMGMGGGGMASSGACASCGTSSRGLFGRR